MTAVYKTVALVTHVPLTLSLVQTSNILVYVAPRNLRHQETKASKATHKYTDAAQTGLLLFYRFSISHANKKNWATNKR